jgi:hypothetical protein
MLQAAPALHEAHLDVLKGGEKGEKREKGFHFRRIPAWDQASQKGTSLNAELNVSCGPAALRVYDEGLGFPCRFRSSASAVRWARLLLLPLDRRSGKECEV